MTTYDHHACFWVHAKDVIFLCHSTSEWLSLGNDLQYKEHQFTSLVLIADYQEGCQFYACLLYLILYVYRFKTGDSGTEMDHYHYNIHGRSMFFEEICGPICKWETLCQVSNVISTNVWKCLAKFQLLYAIALEYQLQVPHPCSKAPIGYTMHLIFWLLPTFHVSFHIQYQERIRTGGQSKSV